MIVHNCVTQDSTEQNSCDNLHYYRSIRFLDSLSVRHC